MPTRESIVALERLGGVLSSLHSTAARTLAAESPAQAEPGWTEATEHVRRAAENVQVVFRLCFMHEQAPSAGVGSRCELCIGDADYVRERAKVLVKALQDGFRLPAEMRQLATDTKALCRTMALQLAAVRRPPPLLMAVRDVVQQALVSVFEASLTLSELDTPDARTVLDVLLYADDSLLNTQPPLGLERKADQGARRTTVAAFELRRNALSSIRDGSRTSSSPISTGGRSSRTRWPGPSRGPCRCRSLARVRGPDRPARQAEQLHVACPAGAPPAPGRPLATD